MIFPPFGEFLLFLSILKKSKESMKTFQCWASRRFWAGQTSEPNEAMKRLVESEKASGLQRYRLQSLLLRLGFTGDFASADEDPSTVMWIFPLIWVAQTSPFVDYGVSFATNLS